MDMATNVLQLHRAPGMEISLELLGRLSREAVGEVLDGTVCFVRKS